MPVKNTEKVKRELQKVAKRGSDARKPLKVIGLYMMRSIAKNFAEGGRPEKWQQSLSAKLTGKRTLIQSAQLKNSITFKATTRKLSIGTNKIYAKVQQFGGTIKPKSKKALTVPIHADAVGMRASDFQNTFVKKGIIFMKRGENAVPLFALKKSVKIPARPFLLFQQEDVDFINKRLGQWFLEGK